MEGPLDFIGREEARSNNWAPSLSNLFANPLVAIGDVATNMLLINPMLNEKKLMWGMSEVQQANLRNLVSRHGFDKLDVHSLRSSVLRMGPEDVGAAGARMGRLDRAMHMDVAMRKGMVERFGARAAGRMSFVRAASGLSRFMLQYTMIDLGIGLAKSLAEAVGSYERPSRPNKSKQLETGGIAFDTRHAQTQRMRSIQAIHNTQLSTRAAMGNEAAFLHMA